MKPTFMVLDDFCPEANPVRQSAIDSGFASWLPNKGEFGSSVYEGMNFWGWHSPMLRALTQALGRPVFPNNMFFRMTTPETECAYVHSDRMWGTHTAIVYLSDHNEVSGTGFYRHIETGLNEMPTVEEMKDTGLFEKLKKDMVEGGKMEWEQLSFVRGQFNRALIFHAPLFHSRIPKHGLGTTPENARMIWAAHFTL